MFPLIPVTWFRCVEILGQQLSENQVTVTMEIRMVMGVTSVVVQHNVTVEGRTQEDTFRWYAQDLQAKCHHARIQKKPRDRSWPRPTR